MSDLNHRIEQSILEYQSRMKHLDEMLARAESGIGTAPEHEKEKLTLGELQRDRDKLGTLYDELRIKSLENWREEEIEISGPMAVWDVVAQKIEDLVERIEK
jgi:hypothetical protein